MAANYGGALLFSLINCFVLWIYQTRGGDLKEKFYRIFRA
jgi:hypothetical protein